MEKVEGFEGVQWLQLVCVPSLRFATLWRLFPRSCIRLRHDLDHKTYFSGINCGVGRKSIVPPPGRFALLVASSDQT
jgi:hypothetical protein